MGDKTTIANTKTTAKSETLQPLLSYFYHWEESTPDQPFLRQPVGDKWEEMSWMEAGNIVRKMVSALQAMNLPKKSNIGIVSKNCSHWILSDLAIMMSGHISVPFYPTLNDEKLNEVLVHSECKVLFIGKLDDWDSMKNGIPPEITCITFPDSPAEQTNYHKWDVLMTEYEPYSESPVPELDDLYTIIYTSGTTGMPKGVMHTYKNIASTITVSADILHLNSNKNRFFSYLPLSHIAERQIVEGASIYSGGSISFVESLTTFAKNLADVKPTHFLAVPRIWTKFQLGILQKMSQKKLDLFLSIPILSAYVKSKIKKSLGLNQAKLILTGAAPMPSSLLKWYIRLGIIIQEAYGMTENCGCCTLMPKYKIKIGTVGKPYPTCDIKINPKDGEVLMKSDWVMSGYYKEPDKTAEVLKKGWLHTGDMGEVDADGYLKITGRVKDQFKCTKGEFIVPGPIEANFASNNNIEQICVVGRGLPQPVALVVLSEIGQQLLKENKNELIKSLEDDLTTINASLLNHEKIQKISIMKEAWTVENNLLTPTLKIKRNILEEVYNNDLETWFNEKSAVVFA